MNKVEFIIDGHVYWTNFDEIKAIQEFMSTWPWGRKRSTTYELPKVTLDEADKLYKSIT